MKERIALIGFSLLLVLPVAVVAAEKASQPGAADQRAACDAQCRDNYQNNSVALQACLRDCGAVGPASPSGAKTMGHELTHTTQQEGAGTAASKAAEGAKVKGSKSNASERMASPAAPPPVPAETSNLNLSKSNIDRVAAPPDAEDPSAEATKVKSSKSNSSERQVAPDAGETAPLEPEDDTPPGS